MTETADPKALQPKIPVLWSITNLIVGITVLLSWWTMEPPEAATPWYYATLYELIPIVGVGAVLVGALFGIHLTWKYYNAG